MSPEELRVVWGLGCSRVGKQLRDVGIRLYPLRRFQQFFQFAESTPPPRCLLLHRTAVKGMSMEVAIRSLRRQWPLVDVVLWAPKATALNVRKAFLAGAKDVLLSERPQSVVESVEQIIDEQRFLPRMNDITDELTASSRFEGLVSRSPKMWDLFNTCDNIAETDATVLIWGETGTGKELLARALHRRSKRKGAFVVLNCGAVPEHLIDSELFGHVKGSFTGAMRDKKGLFRHADGGTLFLDEMNHVPLEVQQRLLRTLQEHTIRPVGGHDEVPVDVRVIAATNELLEKKVKEGSFREDLMYRLSVLYLVVPPLRQRQEDVLFLFAYFMRKFSEQYNMDRPQVEDSFLDALVEYEWPGNVRQLENFVERLLLTNANRVLSRDDFDVVMEPFNLSAGSNVRLQQAATSQSTELPWAWDQGLSPFLEQAERQFLSHCLEHCHGHVGNSADYAGISRRSFTRKMKQHGLLRAQFVNGHAEERQEG